MCMQNLIKIYHVVQKLLAFSLTDHGRTHIVILVQTQGSCKFGLSRHLYQYLINASSECSSEYVDLRMVP